MSPDDPDMFYLRGVYYQEFNQHSNAVNDFTKVLMLERSGRPSSYLQVSESMPLILTRTTDVMSGLQFPIYWPVLPIICAASSGHTGPRYMQSSETHLKVINLKKLTKLFKIVRQF